MKTRRTLDARSISTHQTSQSQPSKSAAGTLKQLASGQVVEVLKLSTVLR